MKSFKNWISPAWMFAIELVTLIVSITLIITQTDEIISYFSRTNEESTWGALPSISWNSQVNTWDNPMLTWDKVNDGIPTDVMWYYSYILKNGQEWVDYVQKIPPQQPNMNAKTSTDNNIRMHDYLYKNQLLFEISPGRKKAYIMFVTTNPVAKDKNIFIGLNGKTIGWLDKNNLPIETYEKNQYLYELSNVMLVGNNWYRFSKDLSWIGELYLNAVVGEANNKVEKIIIFFK